MHHEPCTSRRWGFALAPHRFQSFCAAARSHQRPLGLKLWWTREHWLPRWWNQLGVAEFVVYYHWLSLPIIYIYMFLEIKNKCVFPGFFEGVNFRGFSNLKGFCHVPDVMGNIVHHVMFESLVKIQCAGTTSPYHPYMVYLPTFSPLVDFYGFHFHVGKNTIVPWMRHGSQQWWTQSSFELFEVRTLLTEVLDIAGWPKRRFYESRRRWSKNQICLLLNIPEMNVLSPGDSKWPF